jgi:DNA-binding CsgD family transcriptional regulator
MPWNDVVPELARRLEDESPDPIDARRTAAVAAVAFDAIAAPAFVTDLGGALLHSNARAHSLMKRDRSGLERSLACALAGGPERVVWNLRPLRAGARPIGFLAILRMTLMPTVDHDIVRIAIMRWKLTARQGEVLGLVARGRTNAAISEALDIRVCTVEFHISAIFDRVGVGNRAALVGRLLALGAGAEPSSDRPAPAPSTQRLDRRRPTR